jgi:hypothetical protein
MTELPKPVSMTKSTVTLRRGDWESIVSALEDTEDRAAVRASKERKHDDGLPVDLYRRIRAGEHPIRVWSEHRGIGLGTLSRSAHVSKSYLSEIASGAKPGSASALQRIAHVLGVDMDELVRS